MRLTLDATVDRTTGGFSAAQGDAMGAALVAPCDFNGDGFQDLAVGAPNEDVGTIVDAGAVNVLYGSPSGLSASKCFRVRPDADSGLTTNVVFMAKLGLPRWTY